MITYGSTTLTSYNTITKIEVYYYKSTSATSLSGGSWSTTKPTWENGKYIWQKIRTTYEGKLENGQFYSESDPVNITGQQGATGTAAYSYKLNASDTIITKSEKGEYSVSKIIFTATYKQGTNAITSYSGRFKIETTNDGITWTTIYPTSGTGVNESSKEFTIPDNILSIRCSLYQAGGLSILLDQMTIPIINDGVGTIDPPYKQVEWVESTGKQYVYLDWKPQIKTWGFEVDFMNQNAVNTTAGGWNESTNKNGYGTIFGVRNSSGVNNAQLSSYNSGLLRIGNSTAITTGFKTDHSRQTIKLHGTTITRANGTTATVTRVDENTAKPYCNMAVFGLYEGLRRTSTGNIIEPSSTRIYSLKFYDGDTLAVDLVGSIRKADSITGLYDKVSKHFYPAPGMLFGDEVGDIANIDTVAESLNKADVSTTVVNKNCSRMWETSVPFNRLEDGQKITVTYSYGNVVNSTQTSELVGWDDTSSNSNVYLRLIYPDGIKSEWIPCYYSQTARLTTHYGAGTAIDFTYRENLLSNATETTGGSAIVRGFFANASYYQNTSYTQYSNNVKAGTNGIKGYTLIMKDGENTWSCFYSGAYKVANTGKPVYTGGFILGKILYSAGAGAQTSNSSLDTYYNYKSGVNTSTIYDAYPVDLRYSTNCASTLISQRPVYIVGTVENDGLFHLDVSQWYTQTEPTYADGKVYVYVGMAYSSYQVWLSTENPAYMFYNSEFILYDKAQTLQNINSLKNSLETQIDSKVETWCQKTNPASNWTAEERPNHTGDLWYYIGESGTTYKNNTTYQYNGETNVWSAYSANPDLFDKIDGKSAIYYGTTSSVTSAEEGDYLVDSTDGSSYRWNNGAWVKVTDYKTAINNIQIGGRNLLRNTSITRTGVATKYGLFDILRPTYSSLYALDLDEGEYTLSFDWESSIELPASFYAWIGYGDINGQGRAEMPQNIPAVYTGKDSTSGHYVRTFIWANANDTYPYFACRPFRTSVNDALNDIEFTIKNAKLEKGNKATDWTPAPEDVEEEISTLRTDLQSQIDEKIQTFYQSTNPASSWTTTELRTPHDGDLWYYTGTTTSTYTKDNVYRYNASNNTWSVYSASGELFDKVDGKSTIYYGTTSGTYTGVETGDYLVDSTDGSSYRWDGSKWVKVTDYKTTITNAIDDIEIGGRNLLIKKELGIYAGGNITYNTNKISATETGVLANGLTTDQIPGWKISGLTGNVNIIVHGITNLLSTAVVLYYTCWNGTTKTKAQANFSQQSVNSDGFFEYKATLEIPSESTHITLGFGQRSTSTYELSSLKLEKGNKATDWTPAPEDTTASIQTYVDTLQFQVDHMAEIYYGTAVPTLSNTPASNWDTNDIKDIHVDDLYYNTSTGYCYRFIKSGSTYSWTRIKDSDITAAATAASNANTAAGNAQTTANNANTLAGQKRRIFVSQPTPPYEVGDLWVEGSNGDIKKCKTARATGSYTASDWELASKYTDDTLANEANDKIDNLEIGGRNLFIDQNSIPGFISATEAISAQGSVVKEYTSDFIPVNVGDKYVLQAWVSEITNTTYQAWLAYMFYTDNTGASGTKVGSRVAKYGEQGETYLVYDNIIVPTSAKYIRVSYRKYNNGLIKLEKGNKATDWTPAPEDIEASIDNLEVGGRNLFIGTSRFHGENNAFVTESNKLDNYYTYFNNGSIYTLEPFHEGDTIILQAKSNIPWNNKHTTDGTGVNTVGFWIQAFDTSEDAKNRQNLKRSQFLTNDLGDNSVIFKKKWTIPASDNGKYYCFRFNSYSDGTTVVTAKFWDLKLEKGTKVTDWTPAPEDTQADIDTALAQSVEYIIGTQTAATGNWTGKSSTLTELKDGTQIRYWLPYAGSGNATLNLTLKDGTATGALPVYRQGGSASSSGVVTANRVTTHFPAGTSISMVYGVNRIVSAVYSGTTYTGTFTGWFADGAYDSGNTINRTRLQNVITAETAITAAHIICGTATGYKNIGAGINFDLSYPILYASSAIAATKTGDNNYLQINGINASNNGTIQSGATKKVLYLKGTVSGNIFTISASPFMTTVTPTSTDGFYYIPLGMMYSTTNIYFISSNRLYAYLDGAFQPVDTAAILRAAEAKKTATNYMSSDNTGIMVADLADGEQLPKNATGKNVFITAGYGSGDTAVDAGVHIRNGQEDLASFGETAIIGKENNVHLQIGSTGIYGQNSNNSNDRFFEISQNNGVETIESQQEISEDFSRNNTVTKQFTIKLSENKIDDKIKYLTIVLDKRTHLSLYDITGEFSISNLPQTISISPSSGSYSGTITISEKDENNNLLGTIVLQQEDVDLSLKCSSRIYYSKLYTTPSFTFGSRIIDSKYGGYSTVNGLSNIASGNYSYAGGKETIAEGDSSFAMGSASEARENYSVAIGDHVIAKGNNQTVIGCYNKEDDESLFVIGNGMDIPLLQRRSNALTVDQTGNIFMHLSGSSTPSPSSDTTDGLLYSAIAALGWETDVITT